MRQFWNKLPRWKWDRFLPVSKKSAENLTNQKIWRGTSDGINVCSCPVSARFRSVRLFKIRSLSWNTLQYVVGVFVICFALPGTIITYCYYSFIMQITKVHHLVRNSAGMSNTHQEEIQKLVNVIIFIITAFFLTWGPVQAQFNLPQLWIIVYDITFNYLIKSFYPYFFYHEQTSISLKKITKKNW